jgi:two-component system sensor kinase FixL
MLLWAYEAFRAGQEHGAIQLRLLQTERAATLGNLAAAVFHDIRQPLAAISHSIDAMDMFSESVGALREVVARHKSELSPRDAENLGQLAGDLRDIVKDMRTSCDLVLSATRVIQEWQRPAASGQRPAVDPMPAIEFVTSVCSSRAREAGARVTYDGPASLPKVAIRHAELMQVMINLVLNACDALAGKPGRNKHITIHGAESGEFVSFAVADDGPGMSPDVLNKVGTPFFTTREQGTGLGVAQCKRMVEQTGGVLSIDSKVGVGTTVAFTIPRAG